MHPTLMSVDVVRWRGRRYPADGAAPRRTHDAGPAPRVGALRRMMACAGAALLLLACTDNMAPVSTAGANDGRVTAALLTLDPQGTASDGQSLEVTTGTGNGPVRYETSFSAVQGKQTDFLIQYVVSQAASVGETVMQKALVLSIPAAAHLVDPTGREVPRGTAVQVTVYVVRDGERVEAIFGPEGLGFDGPEPAEIVTSSREIEDPSALWSDTWAGTNVSHRIVKLRRFSNYAVAF